MTLYKNGFCENLSPWNCHEGKIVTMNRWKNKFTVCPAKFKYCFVIKSSSEALSCFFLGNVLKLASLYVKKKWLMTGEGNFVFSAATSLQLCWSHGSDPSHLDLIPWQFFYCSLQFSQQVGFWTCNLCICGDGGTCMVTLIGICIGFRLSQVVPCFKLCITFYRSRERIKLSSSRLCVAE